MGPKIGQLAMFFGANDMGSVMMEENVVSAAGATFKLSEREICRLIRDGGWVPAQRDQYYNVLRRHDGRYALQVRDQVDPELTQLAKHEVVVEKSVREDDVAGIQDPEDFGQKEPDAAWLGRNNGKGDRRGLCIPPYFVFQFRSDGHPSPGNDP